MVDEKPERGEQVPLVKGPADTPNDLEALQREKIEQEQQHNARVLQLQIDQTKFMERQTDAQVVQAQSDKTIALLTKVLLFVAVVSAVVSGLQFYAAKVSADAANSAAKTAKETLDAMNKSGTETKLQIDSLISQQQRTADSMETSLRQNRDSMKATLGQGQKALDATIEESRLDQRAWLGVTGVHAIGGFSEPNRFGVENIHLTVRNSGKTPALKVRGRCCITARRLPTDPIPTYEAAVLEIDQQIEQKELEAKKNIEDLIKERPEVKAKIDQFFGGKEPVIPSWEGQFTDAGVLAPDVTATIYMLKGPLRWSTSRIRPRFPSGMPMEEHLTIFLLGKITYYDVFSGTPEHSTTICLERATGTSFLICRTGQSMN